MRKLRISIVRIPFLVIFVSLGCASNPAKDSRPSIDSKFCRPNLSCWPTPTEWQLLGSSLKGKLEVPQSPLLLCKTDATSAACTAAIKNSKNPFYIEDQSSLTQSTGWLGAWTASLSAYAVVAETAEDIRLAVNFAHQHKIRLVIKSTGHDYLGRSNAPDSLLIWTHKMRDISVQKTFIAQGCPATQSAPAVTVGAGTRWLEAYQEVTGKHHRYVQGGGCTSVGAAGGFLQGGGFGSWSKKYGIAAASLLEAEVVTADGRLLTANACQNEDLFWALRGGGGGTFGVVTKVTLRTYPLPKTFGWVNGQIVAKSDDDFKELIEQFLRFYGEKLNNEHWGEQVQVQRDNSLKLSLAFQGLSNEEAKQVWRPFMDWAKSHGDRFSTSARFFTIPGEKMWDFSYFKKSVVRDPRTGTPIDRFWWDGDGEQVSAYWYAYVSRWIPASLFEGSATKSFANALFEASRFIDVGFHFNKGQAGATQEALERDRETSMNPVVYTSAALIIMGAFTNAYPGISGHEPDSAEAEREKNRVMSAMKIIREVTPDSGSYVNETDYFEPDWQQSFWGENYPKLLEVKRKYDPEVMFTCHHCVGSE